jgi:NTP pyrophosphatase (non-canonical NTP hydrolase)
VTPYEYEIESARTDNPDAPLLAYACGLVGEIGELCRWVDCEADEARSACVDEVGDCLWYLAAICRRVKIPFSGLLAFQDVPNDRHVETQLFREAAAVAEYAKRAADGRCVDRVDWILALNGVLFWLRSAYPVETGSAMQLNINKLRARFPDKWVPGGGIRRNEP